jgi:hypothetical protein
MNQALGVGTNANSGAAQALIITGAANRMPLLVRGAASQNLIEAQNSLNGRPRKTLGYMTPSEKLAQVLALTA